MTVGVLLEQALLLPPEEREKLCEGIWDSLKDQLPDAGEELKRRMQGYDDNPEDVVDWEDIKSEILETRGLKL